MKIVVHQYMTSSGINPFERWFNKLNAVAAAKIATALYRLELGYYPQVKSLGSGLFESKVDFGPGYRIYFGQDGDELIILLGGVLRNDKIKTSVSPRNIGLNISH